MADLPLGQRAFAFRRVAADGAAAPIARPLAIETPVAIEIDGIGYAVMMATPDALEDFATGFCLSERLIDTAADLLWIEAQPVARGVMLRLGLADPARVQDRVRHRVSESSCGLCGIENLEQALRPLPRLPEAAPIAPASVFRALAALRAHQPLSASTGAVHAAAQVDAAGAIVRVREDVGRHNAFDKLVGALARAGAGWDGGFALTTARLSYELVEKAVLAGCPAIAAISAPTSLAVERARAAGLQLFALARPDALLEAVDGED
ncbi:formate dehydrogenase accessory sulfurtransferase FdhD [Sphingomonas morindae]|uniref:Sulfur carrier protein FdhD n=1 Tax=Sphingomonas morindae TaxID=1541170 RepID=A0ABY4X6Y4_9SPHN|nr:formate dehydrogenase accessory sulfurtransferase FdhD [Sphingomonas morindae]USI72683.1 formate dehydrogenase accessory sulfurtransferase FdhD [Sphingomonas morindae]